MKCFDCPRMCGIDRSKSKGFCGEKDKIRVSKVIENFMWEEPCISGKKGALAIFFSGCNLRCDFCQNYDISHIGKGKEYSPEEFRDYLNGFDLTKFDSIDLVTPTHFSSLLAKAFENFSSPIPVVWNSSGYENEKTIEVVSKFVDVFLPDFKYYDASLSEKLSCAKDYFSVASKAIKKMRELKSENIFDGDVLKEGVLIRHLVLPGNAKDSFKILEFISQNIKNPFISLMCQFTPNGHGQIDKKLTILEYKAVCSHAQKLGLESGYVQELSSADDSFIPQF